MKVTLFVLAMAVAACDRPPPKADKVAKADQSSAFPDKPPVIDAAPVDARSYESGFQAGFAAGTEAARPRDAMPLRTAVEQLAGDVAANVPTHNQKWRDGWTNGYLEGFRTRAQSTK